MGFKDDMRPGSFRGASFFIKKSDLSTGRRAVLHEYPNRDVNYTEDMGLISNGFEITGYVLGDDYFTARDRLRDVFSRKGPGELIHPYFGSQMVQVGPVQISESNDEGAIAVFTAKFFEAGDNKFPKGANDKGAILESSVANALTQSKKDFDDNFSIANLPAHAVDSARALVASMEDAFNDAVRPFTSISDGVAKLAFSVRSLVAEVNDLLQAPSILSQRLLDSFGLLEDALTTAEDKTLSLSTFFTFADDFELAIDVAETPVRAIEKINQDKYINFIKRVAVSRAASNAAISDFKTFDDALETRVEITDVLEEQIREDDDTELYQALIDVNASIVEMVPDVDADLPNVKEITLTDTEPSLLIAYDLFEDPNTEQDIIDRNNIRHPGFIPAGSELEVLDAN